MVLAESEEMPKLCCNDPLEFVTLTQFESWLCLYLSVPLAVVSVFQFTCALWFVIWLADMFDRIGEMMGGDNVVNPYSTLSLQPPDAEQDLMVNL